MGDVTNIRGYIAKRLAEGRAAKDRAKSEEEAQKIDPTYGMSPERKALHLNARRRLKPCNRNGEDGIACDDDGRTFVDVPFIDLRREVPDDD
jgi:hypothetical protein